MLSAVFSRLSRSSVVCRERSIMVVPRERFGFYRKHSFYSYHSACVSSSLEAECPEQWFRRWQTHLRRHGFPLVLVPHAPSV